MKERAIQLEVTQLSQAELEDDEFEFVEVEQATTPAGFWLRAGASLVDFAILGMAVIVLILLGLGLELIRIDHFSSDLQSFFGWLGLFGLGCRVMAESRWQATPGKMIFGVKILTEEGEHASFLRILGRNSGKCLSEILLGLGFFMIGLSESKKSLHDRLSGTQVLVMGEGAERLNRALFWSLSVTLAYGVMLLGSAAGMAFYMHTQGFKAFAGHQGAFQGSANAVSGKKAGVVATQAVGKVPGEDEILVRVRQRLQGNFPYLVAIRSGGTLLALSQQLHFLFPVLVFSGPSLAVDWGVMRQRLERFGF